MQRTVLKVDISCHKCKKKLLKAVCALQGVDKVELDSVKGTITVTGVADPYEIIVRTRKIAKFVEVVSVGPPPAPPKQDGQKKNDDKKSDDKKPEGKKNIEDKKLEPKQQIPSHFYPFSDQQMGLVPMQPYYHPYHYQYQEPSTQMCHIM